MTWTKDFPPPWSVEKIPGGLKVCDANGQSLAYVYSRENPNDAPISGKVLTEGSAAHSEQHRQAASPAWQGRGVIGPSERRQMLRLHAH